MRTPSIRSAALAAVLAIPIVPIRPNAASEARDVVILASVADVATGAPIESAQVRLPTLGRVARTNWVGQATIARVPSGTHRIEVRAIGYAPARIDLLARGDTVGPVFMLERHAVELAESRVEARRASVVTREFYQRRAMGIGRFLDDTLLKRAGARSLALTIASHLAGVQAVPGIGFRYGLVSMRPTTSFVKGARPNHAGRPEPACAVDVYLDGFRLGDELDTVMPADLAGVELYPYAMAPPQYRTGRGACHVLLLWSDWTP